MSPLPLNQQRGYPNPQDQVAFHHKNTATLLILLNLKLNGPKHLNKNVFTLVINGHNGCLIISSQHFLEEKIFIIFGRSTTFHP